MRRLIAASPRRFCTTRTTRSATSWPSARATACTSSPRKGERDRLASSLTLALSLAHTHAHTRTHANMHTPTPTHTPTHSDTHADTQRHIYTEDWKPRERTGRAAPPAPCRRARRPRTYSLLLLDHASAHARTARNRSTLARMQPQHARM
mmetsp:Transcript_28345/g.59607  ORF Transcript_28345/g.59607 Transcript_28345/m.59607 type:complete len:150 (-) Transcript_28345:360-809(-)